MITTCPCCKGTGWLEVYNTAAAITPCRRDLCTHCMGSGKVVTELQPNTEPQREPYKASR